MRKLSNLWKTLENIARNEYIIINFWISCFDYYIIFYFNVGLIKSGSIEYKERETEYKSVHPVFSVYNILGYKLY